MKYHVKSLLFYKNKIKGKYDNEIIIEASRKDIDDFVSDFFYYEERDGIISIAHTEIKKYMSTWKKKIVFESNISTREKKKKSKLFYLHL